MDKANVDRFGTRLKKKRKKIHLYATGTHVEHQFYDTTLQYDIKQYFQSLINRFR